MKNKFTLEQRKMMCCIMHGANIGATLERFNSRLPKLPIEKQEKIYESATSKAIDDDRNFELCFHKELEFLEKNIFDKIK